MLEVANLHVRFGRREVLHGVSLFVREGERVRTGDTIGRVGQTGNASGCHLHFELWKGAWQQGGRALPTVTRALRAWDGWS